MDFASAYAQGFVRVAACTVPVVVANPAANLAAILDAARAAHEDGVGIVVFPELALSGYAIDDLFLQDTLLEAVEAAIAELVVASEDLLPVLVVGAPLAYGNRVYNVALVVHRGRVLGVAPKSYLPTYREFYERRWFAPGDEVEGTVTVAGQEVPIGPDLLFAATDVRGLVLHVEVCEDMWVPVPPSAHAALAGATVLTNLSGSPITVGRAEDRRLLVRSASLRCLAAYVYAAAGQGESTTDLSWDGQTMVYEIGDLLAEGDRFPDGPRLHGRRRRPRPDPPGAAAHQQLRRQPPHARHRARRRVPARRVRRSPRPRATSGCAGTSTGSRSCPTTPRGSPWTATRPTTSRSAASSSGCARSAIPRSSSASPAASTPPTR